MKILALSHHCNETDGWGTLARNVLLAMHQQGHEIRSIVYQPSDVVEWKEHRVLPDTMSFIRKRRLWFTTGLKLRYFQASYKPDLVLVLNEPYALALPFLARSPKTKCVFVACGTYSVSMLRNQQTRNQAIRSLARCSRVAAISRYTRDVFIEETSGIQPLSHLQNRTDFFRLGFRKNSFPEPSMPKPGDRKRVLFVGGVKDRKGVLEVVHSFAEFTRISSIPVHLDIVGSLADQNYVAQINEAIKNRGLESKVTLHGAVDEAKLAYCYDQADLFMMLSKVEPQYFEGFGLVFVEANARGIPVIGPNEGGCTDAIEDGVSGYCCDPREPARVAVAMKAILEEGKICSQACRDWAAKHSVSAMWAQLLPLLDAALADQ